MDIEKKDEGKLVELPIKPDWGPGKVVKVDGRYVYIRFKNVPDLEPKKYSLSENPLVLAANQLDPILDRVRVGSKPKLDRRKKQSAPILSFERAMELFLGKYPGKFDDPNYMGDLKNGERFYKQKAVVLYQELFGNGQLRQMLVNKEAGKLAEKTQRVLHAQNLVFLHEVLRFNDVLKNTEQTLQYFEVLANLLDDAEVKAESMIPYFETIKSSPVEGFAKWTNATLLPYLAQPARHIFLKPRVTKNFAEMLGYDLKYETTPNWTTYAAMLNMAKDCKEKLAGWNPKDFIDIQSFIWVLDLIVKNSGDKSQAKQSLEV